MLKISELVVDCGIKWKSVEVAEPSITMSVTDSKLDSFFLDKTIFDFENYPLHIQAVERAINLVSEASSKVCGQDSRDGYIHTVLASIERISKFDTRKDYSTFVAWIWYIINVISLGVMVN